MFYSLGLNKSVSVFLAKSVTVPEYSLKIVESNSNDSVLFVIGLCPGMRVLGSMFVKKLSYFIGVQIFLLDDSYVKGYMVAGYA